MMAFYIAISPSVVLHVELLKLDSTYFLLPFFNGKRVNCKNDQKVSRAPVSQTAVQTKKKHPTPSIASMLQISEEPDFAKSWYSA